MPGQMGITYTVTIPKLFEMKNEKTTYLFGVTYSKNIANFYVFHLTISSSINFLFLKSAKQDEFAGQSVAYHNNSNLPFLVLEFEYLMIGMKFDLPTS